VKYWQTAISPDGRLAAGRTKQYTSANYHAIDIVDRQTSRTRSVDTVKSPLTYDSPEWSRDSKRLLLSMKNPQKKDWTTVGFIIVDVDAGKARTIPIRDDSIKTGRFYWNGDETNVVVGYTTATGNGLRFYDLRGKVVREITGIGAPYNTASGLFSPSGASFVTKCPGNESGDCVWDTATGRKTTSFVSACTKVLGWYDETHLYCWATSDGGGSKVNVVDLSGNALRVLLKTTQSDSLGPYYVRNQESGH
jgi:hypothetical protein